MSEKTSSKNFGAFIDRTLRLIKLNYLKAFKAADIDLTTEQWVVMDTLYNNNGVSQNELANGSFKDAPTVSRIINLLDKKGYAERQRFDNDRRRYKIFLTPKGKQIYEKALPIVEDLRIKGWGELNDEDYDSFIRIMNHIFANFEEKE